MRFQFETEIPLPRETVFQFHANPANLDLLMRGFPGFRVLSHSGGIEVGCQTWTEQKVFRALPIAMGFEHIIYEPPSHFGESLFHGPFQRFVHIHEFEEQRCGTVIRDKLDVEVAAWLGGSFATRSVAARVIHRAFAFRKRAMQRLAREGVIERALAPC